jgi:hypothetical protein
MNIAPLTPAEEKRNDNLFRYTTWCLFFIATFIFALWEHRHVLESGFWTDDFDFTEAFRHTTWVEAWGLWRPGAFWCYRPVFLLYWWAGLQLWGENAFAFHLASVCLHASTTFIFALLIARLTQQRLLGMLAAVLFLLHPATSASNLPFSERSIDAISWISSVSTILAAGFSFATLHAWISWRQNGKKRFAVLALLFFWLALCSKEDAFALPFILISFDFIFWPKANRWWLLPIVLIMASYAGLNYLTNHIAVSAQPLSRNYLHFSLGDRLITVVHYALVIWNGILPMFLPAGIGLFLLLGWFVRQQKLAIAAWIWVLLSVLPAPMGVGAHALATRFYYLPALAITAFSVIGIYYLLNGAHRKGISKMLTRITGVFWLLSYIDSILILPLPDFAVQSCLTFILLCTTGILVKERLLPPFWGSWSAILLMGYSLPFWGLDLEIGLLPFIIGVVLCLTFRQQWRVAILPAFAIAYFTANNPVWIPLLATVAIHITFILQKTGRLKLSFEKMLSISDQLTAAPKHAG